MHTIKQLFVQLCVSLNSSARCIHPLRAPLLQDCGRLTARFLSPLSSLGFHEVRRGCVRPRQHPGSPLCWRPLGVATSRSTSATSSQLLWRDACSQHPIKHSSQTNLQSGLHTSQEQEEDFKTSHKQQQPHQFRDCRIEVVKMLAFGVIPWDLWLFK